MEQAGFPALATTSAGVAFSLGYPDGQRIARDEMLAAVKRIAGCVKAPVSADLEAGYGDAAETARGLIDAGAVGLNLEDYAGDALVEIREQVESIGIVRRVSDAAGIPVAINARTDIYLAGIGDPATRFERACERLAAYRDAGADCLFIPGIAEEALIRRFVEALRFPINVLAGAGTPPVRRLKELGVARVSVGSGLARAALGAVRRIAGDLRAEGRFESLIEGAIPYSELNGLFGS